MNELTLDSGITPSLLIKDGMAFIAGWRLPGRRADIFKHMDKNNDGVVTLDEAKAFYGGQRRQSTNAKSSKAMHLMIFRNVEKGC